jgi:hypothetical protein
MWAVDSIGGDAIRSVQALHDDQGPWRLRIDVRGRERQFVLRSLTPRIDTRLIATGAAALEVAEVHGLRAPRLVAKDLDGRAAGEPVLVHGDVWPGNLAWTGDTTCTLIDWKTAGVGNPGVDLGELRKQIAITYGATTPHIVEAWEAVSGTPAPNIPYWDTVAALNTPTTLYSPEATARRDTFLRAALTRLLLVAQQARRGPAGARSGIGRLGPSATW